MCCDECSTRECNYIEVKMFIEFINEQYKMDYQHIQCPDKCKKNLGYTCDMVYTDSNKQSEIYVEIKKVKFPYNKGKKRDTTIGEENGQLECTNIIDNIIKQSDSEKKEQLKKYWINIPRVQLYSKELKIFETRMNDFISNTTFNKIEHEFKFNRKHEDFVIKFERKSGESFKKFAYDNLLYKYDTEEDDTTMAALFRKTHDTQELTNLIESNAKNTKKVKYPNTNSKKILLNILELPLGYKMFFNVNINSTMSELIQQEEHFSSAADENYLLYYDEDYYKCISDQEVERIGEVLFITPLYGCTFDPTMIIVKEGKSK